MTKKAIIIGSGIAGIASSIRLALKGFQVELFEANSYPGGKLSEIEIEGYRFDAGPSLFTLPEQVDELFRLAGKNPKDYFEYEKLDVACQYFWEDGTRLKAYSDLNLFAEEVQTKLGEPAQNIREALRKSAFIYDSLAPLFMNRSLHQLDTWTNPQALKSYLRIGKLGIFSTMNEANRQQFSHPKLVQLFNRYATYNGSNPYETPATLNIIPHLEFNIGAFFPKKGMHDITMSLYKLSTELGVNYHFGQKVEKVLVENGEAKGIRVKGKDQFADLLVNNMDMVNAYKTILKEEKQPKLLLKQPKSSSALIFYWGIKRDFPELDLHNIFFSDNYALEFEHIFKKGTIYDDPTIYVNITSTHKSDDAPEGCMNWFTMINVPNNQEQDWDKMIAEAKRNILHKLNRILKTDIESLIEVEEILDPRTIESKTSSAQGALYGNSSNNKFAAFLRHANYSSAIKNLYFCGGSVHPGGGIPLCLLSAKIMSEMI
ncbi:phytoene desaturase family protein [Algoriphagus halophytocola]|uniref:Phytoene desaturase family protein n=1 Tax=Algoriphagus halophytocola TaxID=2991499 RepID=A0ABY6MC54_9BACT|nr:MULTISPECIES: 1-hydroxycarotenoid 3,4-desaturase CrtD [unclassified Algoriphagus]UZD21246.1 phytoene desaturase family protein [Algoriphagus sp. TR-M5]WBL42457.1 phytoene desaturase family protein [Algoriphagus sp. TR-M9]